MKNNKKILFENSRLLAFGDKGRFLKNRPKAGDAVRLSQFSALFCGKFPAKTFANFTAAILIILLLVGGFLFAKEKDLDTAYLDKIEKWQQRRLKGLKSKTGWLSLAGLFWLRDGKNTFGSDPANHLIIEEVKAPGHIGAFFVDKSKGEVLFKAAEGALVMCGDEAIFEKQLVSDAAGKATVLQVGSLSWFIIKRGDRLGVRLRDSRHPRIEKLKKIDIFPPTAKWRVKAKLVRHEKPRTIIVPNVLGQETEQATPGTLVFTIDGKEHRLSPLGGGGGLFLIFGDETNTVETYGGGRFLGVEKPDEQGNTIIDFNMAFNPPCAFSPHATCPLPPKENRLSIRVTAGEKAVHGIGGH